MPIRPELRKFYGPHWKKVIRPRILARAGDKCENCAAPNHTTVLRAFAWWTPANATSTAFWATGGQPLQELPWAGPGIPPTIRGFPFHDRMHWTGIVLTVAHLNHIPGDDRDENLKALCQWCHLDHDKDHHKATRATRKDAGRPLLQLAEVPQ